MLLTLLLACSSPPTSVPDTPGPGAEDTDVAAPETPAERPLAPASLARLTSRQLRQAFADLLGEPLPAPPLQADTDPFLFTRVGATSDPYSELGVEQIEQAVDAVTTAVFTDPARRAAVVGCAVPDEACASAFLARFGRRAWRRPLSAEELGRYLQVSLDLAAGDPWTGLRAAVAGLLQAPAFVYRVEPGEPDPEDPSRQRFTGFEMASRLALLLWDSLPDEALLDAADTLTTRAGVEAAARRMLADPRARPAMQTFFTEYLDLDELGLVQRDPTAFPGFQALLAEAMATEVRLLIDEITWRTDGDLLDLLTTRRTFVNDALAAHYGVAAPGASAVAFVPAELPADGPRTGLLTRGAFLVLNAHESTTSPTLRGKFLRERILCDTVPPPPPDVSTELASDGTTAATLREQLEQHRDNPGCKGCHALIDPPGLSFEGFDATGAVRTTDGGLPIDTRGDLDGVPVADARELSELLAADARVSRCVVRQLFRHAHGRVDTDDDAWAIDELNTTFGSSDHHFRELLVALVSHDSFRFASRTTP